jgi:hypothetical protein
LTPYLIKSRSFNKIKHQKFHRYFSIYEEEQECVGGDMGHQRMSGNDSSGTLVGQSPEDMMLRDDGHQQEDDLQNFE